MKAKFFRCAVTVIWKVFVSRKTTHAEGGGSFSTWQGLSLPDLLQGKSLIYSLSFILFLC